MSQGSSGAGKARVGDALAAEHVRAVPASGTPQGPVQAIPEDEALAEVAMKVEVVIVVEHARTLPGEHRAQANARVIDDVEDEDVDEDRDGRRVVEGDDEERKERRRLEEQELRRVHGGDHERRGRHVAVMPPVHVTKEDARVERAVRVVGERVDEHEEDDGAAEGVDPPPRGRRDGEVERGPVLLDDEVDERPREHAAHGEVHGAEEDRLPLLLGTENPLRLALPGGRARAAEDVVADVVVAGDGGEDDQAAEDREHHEPGPGSPVHGYAPASSGKSFCMRIARRTGPRSLPRPVENMSGPLTSPLIIRR